MKILTGEFGIVYKALLDGWRCDEVEQVAVKTLKGSKQCPCIMFDEYLINPQVSSAAAISQV